MYVHIHNSKEPNYEETQVQSLSVQLFPNCSAVLNPEGVHLCPKLVSFAFLPAFVIHEHGVAMFTRHIPNNWHNCDVGQDFG